MEFIFLSSIVYLSRSSCFIKLVNLRNCDYLNTGTCIPYLGMLAKFGVPFMHFSHGMVWVGGDLKDHKIIELLFGREL